MTHSKESGCRWSRRSATASSTRRRCDAWSRHYLAQPVDGLILAATTGEGLTLDEDETARLVDIVAAEVARRIPVYLGVSGSDTRKVAKTLAADRRVAGRRLSDRLPVLHAALAGGPLSPFRGARRRDRSGRSSSTTSRTAPA